MSKDIKDWLYIGDGVYAKYDVPTKGLWLHVGSYDNPTDKVFLEPVVLDALNLHYKICREVI